MFGLFKKPAVIINQDLHTQTVEVSDDFLSVSQANNALSHVVNSDKNIIAFDSHINDFDGKVYDTVNRVNDTEKWHTHKYEVIPVDQL